MIFSNTFSLSTLYRIFLTLLILTHSSSTIAFDYSKILIKARALAGDDVAQYELGNRFESGSGVEQNIVEAIFWYEKSASQNNHNSQYKLGEIYLNGKGVKKDPIKGASWLEKSANNNNIEAKYLLAKWLVNGDGVEIDKKKSFNLFKKASEAGHDKSQYNLGLIYKNKMTNHFNSTEAIKWFTESAEQENADSMYELGKIYSDAELVTANNKKSEYWFEKAYKKYTTLSAQGDSSAKYMIARMLENGQGVKKNIPKAFLIYEEVAELGNPDHQHDLAENYELGHLYQTNNKKALKWYRKAASQGHIPSMYKLAKHLFYRKNNGSDLTEANSLFDKVRKSLEIRSKQNDGYALFELGEYYSLGQGVPVDTIKAKEMYDLAVEFDPSYIPEILFYYQEGLSVFPKDSQKVSELSKVYIEYLEKEASLGDLAIQLLLGKVYLKSPYVKLNKSRSDYWLKKAIKELEKKASYGNSSAMGELALLYEQGIGFKKNIEKAEEWYIKQARHTTNTSKLLDIADKFYIGDGINKNKSQASSIYSEAIPLLKEESEQDIWLSNYLLGELYAVGKGVPKSEEKAIKYFLNSDTPSDASYRIAMFYSDGEHFEENVNKASKWFDESAKNSGPDNQFFIANIYAKEQEGLQDNSKAYFWYKKAAEKGHVEAQFNLAKMLEEGKGVQRSLKQASTWYEAAAKQGDDSSQFHLGYLYEIGQGVPKDNVLAYAWYNLAASQDHDYASTKRDNLKLTEAERSEAQHLSSIWKTGSTLQRINNKLSNHELSDNSKRLNGTAFVINDLGYALTSSHVVNECESLTTPFHDDIIKVVVADEFNDIALIKFPFYKKNTAKFYNFHRKIQQGAEILIYGYPLRSILSKKGNLTQGIISANSGIGNNSNQIQITAPVQPGSSGSPVLNKDGEIVGMVVSRLSDSTMAKHTGVIPQNVNFAVNLRTLISFLDTSDMEYSVNLTEKSTPDLELNERLDKIKEWTIPIECLKK